MYILILPHCSQILPEYGKLSIWIESKKIFVQNTPDYIEVQYLAGE